MALFIFGIDLMKLNWYFIAYIVFSIVVLFYGSSKLSPFGTGRTIIYAIGGALVFIYFGFRWFSNNKQKSNAWPPQINTCPDYLTYRPATSNTAARGEVGSAGCVDLLGVTTSNGNKSIQKSTTSNIATATYTLNTLFQHTSDDITAKSTPDELQFICTACKEAGITWEGVYDGDSCTAIRTVSQKVDTSACVL